MEKINIDNTNKGTIAIYRLKDGKARLKVKLEKQTVWLTQKQMAYLFAKDLRTVNEHIQNIFREGELRKKSVIRNFRITAEDGRWKIDGEDKLIMKQVANFPIQSEGVYA